MKFGTWVVWVFVVAGTAAWNALAIDPPEIKKACYLFSKPDPESEVLCQGRRGMPIVRMGKPQGRFLLVEVPSGCAGYISEKCVANYQRQKKRKRRKRPEINPPSFEEIVGDPKSESASKDEVEQWTGRRSFDTIVAAFGYFNYQTAGVTYSTQKSTGVGFGLQVDAGFVLGKIMKFTALGSIQRIRLSRDIDTSGVYTDPTPNTFAQVGTYAGGGLMVGVQWSHLFDFGNKESWLDVGAEYLLPLSVTQTDSVVGDVSVGSPDKLFFLIFGPSGVFPLDRNTALELRVHGTINLAATGGSSMLGVRAGLALRQTL